MEAMSTNTTEERGNCEIPNSISYPVILVNTLTSLLGTFANTLIWVAVMKNSRLQTLANYFLLSLALADMLVTCVTQPLFIASNIFLVNNQCNIETTTAYSMFAYLSCMASILNLTSVSIDRLITLKYPLQKRTILPKRRGFFIIAVAWGLALLYMVISYFYQGTMTWVITTSTYFIVCYLTMILTHSHMYIVSNRFVKRRKLHVRRQSFSMVAYTKEREAAKTVVLIIALLTMTWLPYGCAIALSAVNGKLLKRNIGYPLLTIGLINSSINPVLYSWRNKDFRVTFRQLLRCQDPNAMRRESISSLHMSRSKITSVSIFNDSNVGHIFDNSNQNNRETPCFLVNKQFPLEIGLN